MKRQILWKVAILAIPLFFSACAPKKQVVKTVVPVAKDSMEQRQFLQKVSDNAQYVRNITCKIKFNVQVGSQDMTLTGNLRMRRDDVIQLQLMAFGFVEAGRLEFTKDYVMVVDRINKQFIKANYSQLTFLQQSGLNFYSLQALFWNELFQPGFNKNSDESLKNYSAVLGGDDVVITLVRGLMNYKWLANNRSGRLEMANISYNDVSGKTQLNWDYNEFKEFGNKLFPTDMKVTFSTPSKEVKINMVLNYLGSETNWDNRTEVSDKYKQVSVDEILRRFMAL